MKVIIDSHVPYLRGLIEPYADVDYLEPADITPAVVRRADALIVRTRTRCDASLLDGSNVRLILTATIGYDHIDRTYCAEHGIEWHNCPGCNAQGVCDYVESALVALDMAQAGKTLGIVGVGHVGSLVEKMARRRGLKVLCCDPIRQANGDAGEWTDLATIAREADVITFHTPLTRAGEYATHHMADAAFLASTKKDVLIINSARGGIVDEAALLASKRRCVIDCWEGEPQLNRELLAAADLATFHIAGYTKQGKYNASKMVLDAFSAFFGLPPLNIEKNVVSLQSDSVFDIRTLSDSLKADPAAFESLREHYPLR